MDDLRCGQRAEPANKLSQAEREEPLAAVNSEELRDLPPSQIVPKLADEVNLKFRAKMEVLGVLQSFSRPANSDDNPFSEALFRTMKYRRSYPDGSFASVQDAQAWVDEFVARYHAVHLHSGITFTSPTDRHEGHDVAILEARRSVYAAA